MDREAASLSALTALAVPVSSKGREYRAYPSIARVRWLFPADSPDVRRAGIRELFHPKSMKGRVYKKVVEAGGLRGGRLFLDAGPLAQLEEELSGALGVDKVRVAFYVGTPGAYRKVTVQVVTPSGELLGFAKLAVTASARADVEVERSNLTRLSYSGLLRGRIPEILGFFRWQESDVLLLSGGPPATGPDKLSAEHLTFLRDLFLLFSKRSVFSESSIMSRMSERILILKSTTPEPLYEQLGRSLERLRKNFGPVEVPLSFAHRDFAPWNTRSGSEGLFVFDWDRAEDGITPLYDAFHFQAIQAALFGTYRHVPNNAFLLDLLDALWPGGREHLPHLHLAYLLDQALFYAEARATAPETGEGGVLDWFAERLRVFPDESPRL